MLIFNQRVKQNSTYLANTRRMRNFICQIIFRIILYCNMNYGILHFLSALNESPINNVAFALYVYHKIWLTMKCIALLLFCGWHPDTAAPPTYHLCVTSEVEGKTKANKIHTIFFYKGKRSCSEWDKNLLTLSS